MIRVYAVHAALHALPPIAAVVERMSRQHNAPLKKTCVGPGTAQQGRPARQGTAPRSPAAPHAPLVTLAVSKFTCGTTSSPGPSSSSGLTVVVVITYTFSVQRLGMVMVMGEGGGDKARRGNARHTFSHHPISEPNPDPDPDPETGPGPWAVAAAWVPCSIEPRFFAGSHPHVQLCLSFPSLKPNNIPPSRCFCYSHLLLLLLRKPTDLASVTY